ncbi:5'-deoxynucleotidase HDDC2 isoform X2 [Dermacentor silvarum]|uniref:5'-deoxynucleotidase HDDC2 isoform X2 n=1 Tax=Dermacentor silvarum TaxID=543639 RepID=UPI002100740D|nr:5'-deoxynucleotidase HDDC2 isoform X2 [Dermacentor silvarum]
MANATNALSYFMLIGKLKGIRRTGWVLRGVPDPERISGHMYRMSIMAMMVGNDPEAGVDKDKCIRMALVHDMGECIVGDITPTCGVSKEEKYRRESEYEAQNSPESKVVKDLDMFDMILQAHEYEVEMQDPGKLQEFFDSTNGRFQHRIVKTWVEELYKLRATHLSQKAT